MKNLSKLSLLVVFLSIFISTPVFATIPTVAPTPTKAVLLATVNISNAKIVSQKGNTFNISFSLSNREGLQTDVKYGVKLVQESTNSQMIIDERIYDESFTLNPNTITKKEITYTAPAYLSGSYTLVINSKNSSGFPFGSANLGKVILTATTKGVEILGDTCKIQIIGDKTTKTYTIAQIPSINLGEVLKLTCEALNSSKVEVVTTPFYEAHLRSSFGEVLSQTGGSTEPITFKTGEKKSFSVSLPKATTPQLHNINFILNSKDSKSNTINFNYMVLGTNAIIHNLSLDKDYYKSGDKALVSLVATSNASPSVTSSIQISNSKGKSCAKTQTEALSTPIPSRVDISIPIRSSCIDPKITVTLTDDKGTVLAQKEFNVKTTSAVPLGASNSIIWIIIILIVIIIVYFYFKNKKNIPPTTPNAGESSAPTQSTTNSIPMNIIFPFLLLVALFGFVPTEKASADTFGIGAFVLDANLNSTASNYTIGSAGMEVNVDLYDNSNPYTGTISATVDISTPTLVTTNVWRGNILPISSDKQVTVIPDSKLPFDAGNYVATFTVTTTGMSGQNDPISTDPYGLPFTMKAPVNTTAPPDPTVSVSKASTGNILYNTTDTIIWSSTNTTNTSCTSCSYSPIPISDPLNGNCTSYITGKTFGSFQTPNLKADTVFTITCNN